MTIKIYTDGSGNGGWGAVIVFPHGTEEIGGTAETDEHTNNQMELTAVIEGLKYVKHIKEPIEVYTDSSYISNCFRDKWYLSWERHNWIKSDGKQVKNKELWQELLKLVRSSVVNFKKVAGHSGDTYNERADRIATEYSKT